MATQTATELQTFEPDTSTLIITPRNSHGAPGVLEALPAALTASEAARPTVLLPKSRAILAIAQVYGQSFFSSFCNGIVVGALPTMQSTLDLQ